MGDVQLKAPFPYFGGKRRVAGLVWSRLGDCDNVIEPFCGSAAFLLARPHPPRVETVNDPAMTLSNFDRAVHPDRGDPAAVADAVLEVINDADPHVANAWRSIQRDPEQTAAWADNAVNESYLHAVHRWLVLGDEAAEFRRRMRTDPDFYDPARAGRWIFGLCAWIGGGWCSFRMCESEQVPRAADGNGSLHGIGVHSKGVPAEKDLASKVRIEGDNPGSYGKGVHAKGGRVKGLREEQPTLEQCQTGGKGVHGVGDVPLQRPALGGCNHAVEHLGNGVHSKGPVGGKAFSRGGNQMPCNPGSLRRVASPAAGRPQLADAYDIGTCKARRAWLVSWFGRLRDRLRLVRVCCGDWHRVCGSDSVTTRLGTTGIFFDPPYSLEAGRDNNLYAVECGSVAHEVRAYCLERGGDPRYRICLAGYADEGHEPLEAAGWSCVPWRAQGGYGNRSAKGKANAGRERLWFSPHCISPDVPADLFSGSD